MKKKRKLFPTKEGHISKHNIMRLEINYKKKNYNTHEHVEAKKYATKQPVGH